MNGINKVIIVGTFGRDPETKYLADGGAVCNFSLATNEVWKDKNGEKQEKTEWHRCTAFGKAGEVIGEYMKKGSSIYVEGRLQTRKWQDKDGNDKYSTDIVVTNFQFLGGGRRDDDGERSSKPQKPSRDPKPSKFDDFEDDIPF